METLLRPTTETFCGNDKEKLIQRLTELAESNQYVFRGYTKQDQLLPNIIRNKCEDIETALLFEFERSANQYINTSNPVDFMSYAQHYGLSTRLLDFTYNPFIALYFSLFKQKGSRYSEEDDKDFYYICYCRVDDNILINQVPIFDVRDYFEIKSMAKQSAQLIDTVDMMFNKGHIFSNFVLRDSETATRKFFKTLAIRTLINDSEEYVQENLKKVDARKLLFIDPNQSNQRLVMQQGLFLFPYTLDVNEHLGLLQENAKVIKIHKSIREELQRYLDTIGINAYRLMPDLSSVCEAVERKIKENRAQTSNLFKKMGGI